MSHIQGHVDDTGTPPGGPNMMIDVSESIRKGKAERRFEMNKIGDQLLLNSRLGLARISGHDGFQISYLNEGNLVLQKDPPTQIGLHIILTRPGEGQNSGRYHGYATDIVLWSDHQATEKAVLVHLLGDAGADAALKEKSPRLEDLSIQDLTDALNKASLSEAQRSVLGLTIRYMKTPSFKMLYVDPTSGTSHKADKILSNIKEKVIFKPK